MSYCFMKLCRLVHSGRATSPLKHKPTGAHPIRRAPGTDEIGLFNSLYRNMLMQDNDSLIACDYRMCWEADVRATTGKDCVICR